MYLLLLYINILVDTQWSGSLKITKGKKKKNLFYYNLGVRERERMIIKGKLQTNTNFRTISLVSTIFKLFRKETS